MLLYKTAYHVTLIELEYLLVISSNLCDEDEIVGI